MRASLIRLAAFAGIIWFQFAVYPGHTYVQYSEQIFVPQFEHLDSPGFLTRDAVATHANLSLTIFDEASVALHRKARLDWPAAMGAQQIVSRSAGLCGLILLAGAAGMTGWWPMLIAAVGGLLGRLPGIDVSPFGVEAAPWTLAFGFVLLAAGLFARGKPLLSGALGGVALLYDPRIAVPFWIILLLALLFDRSLRLPIRAMLPILLVFALLLANFAQLQPAAAERVQLLNRLPAGVEAVQRFRTPNIWVASWPAREILFFFALFSLSLWATVYRWRSLSNELRWLFLGLPATGLLSLAVSVVCLSFFHLQAVALLHPERTALFIALPGAIVCAIAARVSKNLDRWLFLAGPILLVIVAWARPSDRQTTVHIEQAAAWAQNNTWGASMFLFPDAGQSPAPAAFRARSMRPVWVDWGTGSLCDSSDAFAVEWQERWVATMASPYSWPKLRSLLHLPIDYVVLSPEHAISGAKPVFANSRWLIYDTTDLRKLPKM